MDRRQLRKEQRRRLVRLQKLLQLRYQIGPGVGGLSDAAHGDHRRCRGALQIDLRARYGIEGVGVVTSTVLHPASTPWLGHLSPRRRARRQRKQPDWGNGGHGAHGTRAGRAPASPRGPDGETDEGARASTCGCRPDSARRLGGVAANWLCRSRISSAFSLAFSQKQNSSAQKQNSSALLAKRSAFRKTLTLNCPRPP